jgi:sodium/proline symporter
VGGFVLNWYLLAPALQRYSHRHGALTVTDVIAGAARGRGERWVRRVAATIVVVSLTGYIASQFQGAGKTFAETFGLRSDASIVLGGGIVLAYTLLGGFWAVSRTDALQGLVMAAAACLLPVAALAAVGGPAALADGMRALPGFTDPFGNASASSGLGFVVGILGIGLGYPGQPHVVNRFMALRQGGTALRTARRVAIGWAVVVYAGMLLLGWCGRLLTGDVSDSESIFIRLAGDLFPPVVSGVLLAAVLSAIMSTADSQLLVAASSLTHDVGRGRPETLLQRSRLIVFLLTVAGVLAAIWGSQEIFHRVLFAWNALGAAFGPALLVTVLRGPLSTSRALLSMLAGFSLSVLFYSIPATSGSAIERWVPYVAAAVPLIGGGRPSSEE